MLVDCGSETLIIEKAKKDLLESTNIEHSPDEMKVLNDFLRRCWQMGWLKKYETADESKALRLLLYWAIKNGFGYDQLGDELVEKYDKDIEHMSYMEGLIYIANKVLEDEID